MKGIFRKILAKTGAGAPDPPRRLTLSRNAYSDRPIREGDVLWLWLKPDSIEIRAYFRRDDYQDEYVGHSNNYALARYLMAFGSPPARIYSLRRDEIIVDLMYGKERDFEIDQREDDFV